MTTGGARRVSLPRRAWEQNAKPAYDYWELLKPRIMLLIVITTIGSLALAAQGWPGTALRSGRCSASCSCRADRAPSTTGTTATSTRSCSARALARSPAAACAPDAALALGVVLAVAGIARLALAVNWLAAFWALAGFVCYVFVYTVWLKRRTPQNIVIGGAAGAVPPLVAWAAVTGSVTATAVALFVIVFLWTPPHFWAVALLLDEDYARAGVPMLPTVRGAAAAASRSSSTRCC